MTASTGEAMQFAVEHWERLHDWLFTHSLHLDAAAVVDEARLVVHPGDWLLTKGGAVNVLSDEQFRALPGTDGSAAGAGQNDPV